MHGAAGTVLVIAVVVIAVAQLGLFLGVLVLGRRLMGDLLPLLAALREALHHLQEATDRIGALAEQTGGTVAEARRAAAHVGAIAGAGRSLLEGSIGRAIVRRLIPGAVGGAAGTPAVQAAVALALGLYRAWNGRRSRERRQDRPPAGLRRGSAAMPQASAAREEGGRAARRAMRIGTIRRVDRGQGRPADEAPGA